MSNATSRRCRHFTGALHNEKCKAGVHYRSMVGGPDFGWMARLPCLPDSPLRKDMVTCAAFDPFSPAEEMADALETKARFEKVTEAIRRIKETGNSQGYVVCPKCSNQLHFSIAKFNGHVWGKCETEGCLAWMM